MTDVAGAAGFSLKPAAPALLEEGVEDDDKNDDTEDVQDDGEDDGKDDAEDESPALLEEGAEDDDTDDAADDEEGPGGIQYDEEKFENNWHNEYEWGDYPSYKKTYNSKGTFPGIKAIVAAEDSQSDGKISPGL